MSAKDPNDHRLDHLVAIMFENRSFDNLLGALYTPAERPTFEGVLGRNLSNPAPSQLRHGGAGEIPAHLSTSFAAPYPDPGEEYPHVNTQLFGTVNPTSNRLLEPSRMTPPYNLPEAAAAQGPSMRGFVEDYAGAFRDRMGRDPSATEYSQIMAYYSPDQVPVLSGLARGFTTFDHWFCEVPSQTYPNRSFFHAATSSGFVLNGHPAGKFALRNDAKTIFEQLEEVRRTWKIYIDPAQILPATALIHARRLAPYFADHFGTIYDFYAEAAGGSLPNYAFIEPNMFHPHTDMHPHSGARTAEDLHFPTPDTLRGGEQLLARVYSAIRDGANRTGSNWSNTALLVTFDEHGGTYDHVPPPATVPPDRSTPEQDFTFDRLGVRVPTLLISAWATEGRVVSSVFQSTSSIRTLQDWWGIGARLTQRDASAPNFIEVLDRTSPRPPSEWPQVSPRSVGVLGTLELGISHALAEVESPLERLERDFLGDALAAEAIGTPQEGVVPDAERMGHREAHDHFHRISGKLFPGLANSRTR